MWVLGTILFWLFLLWAACHFPTFMEKKQRGSNVKKKIRKSLHRISHTYSKSIILLIVLPLLTLGGCCANNMQPVIRSGIVIHPTPADVNNISDSLAKQILENNKLLEK